MPVLRPLAGRYAFLKRVGGSQRAVIWLAKDPSTSAIVVASLVQGPRAAGLEPLVELRHEHAAMLLEVLDPDPDEIPEGEAIGEDARVAIAEYVEGRSLQQRVAAGPLGRDTAVDWVATIADVLSVMHERGGVHGAVSPRSILAIRPALAQVPLLTQLIVPTSGAYCSPERVTGGGPSESDDTWALAATLYTCLTRRVPFHGVSRTDLAREILSGPPPPLGDDVDEELAAIVHRGLAKSRAERFSGAAELRDVLRDWIERSGRQSVGDFAPVDALVGPSEPPPNVGDLSLVAAFVRPDSAEAKAPLQALEPSSEFVTFAEADDIRAAASIPPVIGTSKRPPPPLPSRPPPLPSRPPPRPSEPAARPSASGVRTSGRGPSTQMNAAASVASRRTFPTAAKAALAFALGGSLASGLYFLRSEPGTPAAAASPATSVASVDQAPPPAAPAHHGESAGPATAAPAVAPAESAAPAASSEAPAPLPVGDVNACSRALLPAETLGPTPDLSYLCAEKEMWSVTLRTNLQIAKHGRGEGMVSWMHLGRFDVAAVAILRTRCCPGARPLRVATPKGMCETITASVLEVASSPTSASIDRYAADVDCIMHKGMNYPREWWDRVGLAESRGAFEGLVQRLPH